MLKEIRQKISLSPELEKKIKWASNYSTTEINVENGTLIKLITTNIAYVEAEGGTENFRYETKNTTSELSKYLRIGIYNKPKTKLFLRKEHIDE